MRLTCQCSLPFHSSQRSLRQLGYGVAAPSLWNPDIQLSNDFPDYAELQLESVDFIPQVCELLQPGPCKAVQRSQHSSTQEGLHTSLACTQLLCAGSGLPGWRRAAGKDCGMLAVVQVQWLHFCLLHCAKDSTFGRWQV